MVGERDNNHNNPHPHQLKAVGPCPTIIHISRTPGTEVSQHRSPTRQPPYILMMSGRIRGQS